MTVKQDLNTVFSLLV